MIAVKCDPDVVNLNLPVQNSNELIIKFVISAICIRWRNNGANKNQRNCIRGVGRKNVYFYSRTQKKQIIESMIQSPFRSHETECPSHLEPRTQFYTGVKVRVKDRNQVPKREANRHDPREKQDSLIEKLSSRSARGVCEL